jgi:hypothetical protein
MVACTLFGQDKTAMLFEEFTSTPVEAWGYQYNRRDLREVWRKKFRSETAARAWADFYNATIVEIKPIKPDSEPKEEKLDELSFLGSPCTKDCSGHRAGYDWSAKKGNIPGNSPYSPSFNNGANLRAAGK